LGSLTAQAQQGTQEEPKTVMDHPGNYTVLRIKGRLCKLSNLKSSAIILSRVLHVTNYIF